MSLLMMLAMGSRRAYVPTERTKTFTQNETWTAPVGVNKLKKATGYGARGKNGTAGTTVKQYYFDSYDHVVHPNGTTSDNYLSTSGMQSGAKPSNYCEPLSSPDGSGNRAQICYRFYDSSFSTGTSSTTGAAANGFGKVFPGGTGDVAPAVTSFSDVPLTSGAPYAVTVPPGGSITITWME